MTMGARALTVAVMARGLAVAYTGDDFNDGLILSPEPASQFLFRGHRGCVAQPDPYHLSVDWVGLEDEVMSFGMGWGLSTDNVNDPIGVFTQIAVITDEEFDRRSAEIFAGRRPVTD